jgi:hypothetical protein
MDGGNIWRCRGWRQAQRGSCGGGRGRAWSCISAAQGEAATVADPGHHGVRRRRVGGEWEVAHDSRMRLAMLDMCGMWRMRMGRGGPMTDEAGDTDEAGVWGGVRRMGLLADGVDWMI